MASDLIPVLDTAESTWNSAYMKSPYLALIFSTTPEVWIWDSKAAQSIAGRLAVPADDEE